MVKLHICGNTVNLLNDMSLSGAHLFNVDHMVALSLACEAYGKIIKCFKGNIDPVKDMLQASPKKCQEKSLQCIKAARGKRYMLSPGCEVRGDVTDEVFTAFCQSVKK